ncbi:MAG: hypothetical protein Q9174_004797 [Haloplaca sp. 1 TL-2023]
MAEPLSVIGTIAAVAQITTSVVKYIKAVKHASSESRQLLLEIKCTSGVLVSIKDLAEETSPEDPWSRNLADLAIPLEEYQALLQGLFNRLEPTTGSKREALKWPFRKKDIAETLESLDRQKASFMLTLQKVQTEISSSTRNLLQDTNAEVRQLTKAHEAKESAKILQWISPLDFRAMQSETLRRRHANTSDWILSDPTFACWVFDDFDTLRCEGGPGTGKTIIAAVVINHLECTTNLDLKTKTGYPSDLNVSYLYCTYRDRATQTAENLLGSLLRHVIEQHPQFMHILRNFHESYRVSHENPTAADLVNLLGIVFASFRRNFVIVDAIDECAEDVKDTVISSLVTTKRTCNLQIMITSRPNTIIHDSLGSTYWLQIRARDEDIKKYLTDRVHSEGSHFRVMKDKPGKVEDSINTIVNRSEGMFLMARLHLDSVANSKSIGALNASLQRLPKQLNATYEDAMLRVTEQDEDSAKLAMDVLKAVVHAWRPFSLDALQQALAANETDSDEGVDATYVIDQHYIINSCMGLITLDPETNTVRIVHHSAEEYFTTKRQELFPHGDYDMARLCLKYLSSKLFSQGRCTNKHELVMLNLRNPFLTYASFNWGHHVRESGRIVDLESMILSFMSMDSNFSCSIQTAYSGSLRYPWTDHPSITPMIPPLVDASLFGLTDIVASLLDHGADINETPPGGCSALNFASQNGYESVARLLLDRGAKLHQAQHNGVNPFIAAAATNRPNIVRMLWEHDNSIIGSKNTFGKTALHDAAERGFHDTVELLIQCGSNLTGKSNEGWTPLVLAAHSGHIPTLSLLLKAGAPIDCPERDTRQATYVAAKNSNLSMLQFLFDNGAAVGTRGFIKNTVLHGVMVGEGDAQVMRLITEQKGFVDMINYRNVLGKTALHDGADRNQLAAVSILLEYDPVFEPDKEGRTPLHCAVQGNHVEMTKLLLTKPAGRKCIQQQAGSKHENKTVLQMAVDMNHKEIIKLLSEAL